MNNPINSWLDFLNQDPAWAIGFVIGIAILLLVISVAIRHWTKSSAPLAELSLLEDLGQYPPAPPLPVASPTLKVHGLPARIRLIVIAPLGKERYSSIDAELASGIVNEALPNLTEIVQRDQAKARIWPPQLSNQGFAAAVQRHTLFPVVSSQRKKWLLVVGKVIFDERSFGLAIALWTEKPHTLGPIILDKPHRWMEVLQWVE